MSNIKLKNLLAENMRRFRTKNLNEYYIDQPGHNQIETNYGDLLADLKLALRKKEGRIVIKIAEKLLKYLTVGVYKKLQWQQQKAKKDSGWNSVAALTQEEIDKIQEVNQDVIKDAINVLKSSPQNMPAMQTIYDIVDDLYNYVED